MIPPCPSCASPACIIHERCMFPKETPMSKEAKPLRIPVEFDEATPPSFEANPFPSIDSRGDQEDRASSAGHGCDGPVAATDGLRKSEGGPA